MSFEQNICFINLNDNSVIMSNGFHVVVQRILLLGGGVVFAIIAYFLIFNSTGNPTFAIIAFALVLVFWIGTLRAIVKFP
jgi:hypothetical protein